ncbi:MAG: ATP-dependent 6-phosphofructokinase [Bacteriovoracaceae bacterium]|nr:ATP-dependent 6-phosphofructokinase [Bacteriovoracaceae bacterium]
MLEKINITQKDFKVETLPHKNVHYTPIKFDDEYFNRGDKKIIYNNILDTNRELENQNILTFERPSPSRELHFNPHETNVGIVTCGGLCPGLNDVIRAITLCSLETYKVKNVYGFRFGYLGLTSEYGKHVIRLNHNMVDAIHEHGGTILSSSRGNQSIEDMVDTLVKFNISILFTIGGDGTQKGAMSICEEIKRRKLDISVVGIPKTIDNDLSYIYRTFGFYTAVEEARKAINAAHIEAKGAQNGIGLVKLMGRHSGSIAAHSTLASGNANICLIPEIKFDMKLLCETIMNRFSNGKDHIVIVTAEGVGQEELYRDSEKNYDASGNLKLMDIGVFLKKKISTYLGEHKIPHTLKYIDPSYMIRSTLANANDSSFCLRLGNNAVHAGFAGKTNCLVGYWNQHFTLTPIKLAVDEKKIVNTGSSLWRAIEEITLYNP